MVSDRLQMPRSVPASGFVHNTRFCVYVTKQGDITMNRFDIGDDTSLCWSGKTRQKAWTQARIIAMAWAADHDAKLGEKHV